MIAAVSEPEQAEKKEPVILHLEGMRVTLQDSDQNKQISHLTVHSFSSVHELEQS